MPNPELVKRYFHHGATTPKVSPDTYYFLAQKPADEIRLVLLGGSTAAGFPYGRFGSPSGLLEARLQSAYPDKNIRVISVAMSSINSYTLRDISEDVLSISPDAVLIYAGHNEYLGVMGVGSVYASKGGHLANLLYLKLKNWRTFQLAQSLLRTEKPHMSAEQTTRTVMAKVAQSQLIPYGSDVYHHGIAQFRSNLNAVLSGFRDANIPTFVSTLAANEKDQPPFSSSPAPAIGSLDTFITSNTPLRHKQKQAQAAVAASPDSADAHFALASMLSGNDDTRAARHFIQAVDRDQLRFRAPSVFNEVIHELTQQHQMMLVDTHNVMKDASPGGHIGNNLMLEHLHPNERGYFTMAEAFYNALQYSGFLAAPTLAMTSQKAWQQRPLSPVDAQLGALKVQHLKSDYPFTDTPKPFQLPDAGDMETQLAVQRFKGAGLLSQLPGLITFYQQQGRWQEAANSAAALASALPFNAETAQLAAQIALRADQPGRAWFFSRQAVTLAADNISYQLTLAESQFKAGKRELAIRQLRQTQQQFPEDPKPGFFLKQLGARL